MIAVNVALQLLCAIMALGLRPDGPEVVPATAGRSWEAFRDRRFLLATALSGILELFQPVLAVGVPLWIVNRTDAPGALVAALTVVNTVLVVLLQVAVGKGSDTVSGSGKLLLRAGLLMALACCLFAGSGAADTSLAVVLLFAYTVLMTLGELAQSAAWAGGCPSPCRPRAGWASTRACSASAAGSSSSSARRWWSCSRSAWAASAGCCWPDCSWSAA